MKTTIRLFMYVVVVSFLLSSCATTTPQGKTELVTLMNIEGVVQGTSGNELAIELKLPEFQKTPEPSIGDIAQQVVQKSLFIEGIETEVNGTPATIKEVMGKHVRVLFEKPVAYPPGTAVKLKIPKKTVAVVDFEVIRGNEQAVGRVTLEGLTSALIESGHFNIVERSKLKTIMNELELSLSGLTKEAPEKIMGKLIMADLILTGTMADLGGNWDINLRLVNVKTGQAMSSISMRTPLIKPLDMRDSSPMNEVFNEDTLDASWILGLRKENEYGKEGVSGSGRSCNLNLDFNEGPEGTRNSLKIDYNFTKIKEWTSCMAQTRKKRDLAFYSGVEFYAKATRPITGRVNFLSSQPDNPNTMDSWIATFRAGTEWKKFRIPFSNLMIARGWIKGKAEKFGAKPGDQLFRPNRIEQVGVGVESSLNPLDAKGSLWVGKMRFYRD
jgi:TolB-like protein